jgi:Zn-finger nucleic acid-binding protein
MIFEGANFCAYCGAETSRAQKAKTDLPCPSCKNKNLGEIALGNTPVMECASCQGLWVDTATFDRICTDREKQAAVLGGASEVFRLGQDLHPVRYVKCPECLELMHRVNFAKCSGIVVDICKGHGTWFDRDELQHIVQFIRSGGLDLARQKEKAELDAERKRIEAMRRRESVSYESHYSSTGWAFGEQDLFDIAGSIWRALD